MYVFGILNFCAIPCGLAQDGAAPEPAAAEQKPEPPKVPTEKEKLKTISDEIMQEGWWGQSGYFSPVKLPLYMLIFILWTGSASWINADQERLKKLNRELFNIIYCGIYLVLGTAVFFIPIFWAAFPLTLGLCFIPAIVYVVVRNKPLPPGDRVMTPEHLWFLFAESMGKIGIKIPHTSRKPYEGGPPVDLQPLGKGIDQKILTGRLILARNAPGYNLLRECLYDAVHSRATAVRFDFSPEQTKIQHRVDGTWLNLVPVPRTLGKSKDKDIYEEMLDSVKKLVGGKPEDRRSRQSGTFRAVIGNPQVKSKLKKFDIEFVSQGTPTGEAAMLQMQSKSITFKTLDELNIRSELQPKIMEIINAKKGIALIAAPPEHGLRTSVFVFAKVCDRFTRDVANIEEAGAGTEPIENVSMNTYDASKGETPFKHVADLVFKGISLLIIRELSDTATLEKCSESLSEEDRLFLLTVRAKDSVAAVSKILSYNVPPPLMIPHLNAVICQRLIRTLCPACKEAYTPDTNVLQQLRLNPKQVTQLYRKRTPLPPHEESKRGICPKCHGVGYYGRVPLIEILMLSDEIKALFLANSPPEVVRQQMNKEKQVSFLQEGIRLLIKGDTSVDELSKTLKM